MNSEPKYYTPTIEEFCVGFEVQIQNIENAQWGQYVVTKNDKASNFEDHIEMGNIRVKLLDRADIEGEGWEWKPGTDTRDYFTKTVSYRGDEVTFKMCYIYSTQWLLVWAEGIGDNTRFSGHIRNITEFRKLPKAIRNMSDNPHIHYHAFIRHMQEKMNLQNESCFAGIEAIEAAEEYARTHPEIKIAYCDDNMFASSIIVLVPHLGMGVSFLFIPQLTNEQGNLFLYPNHLTSLLNGLVEASNTAGGDKLRVAEKLFWFSIKKASVCTLSRRFGFKGKIVHGYFVRLRLFGKDII